MTRAELSYIPDRGDIVWMVLDPRTGHEQSGRRPVLVLSPRVMSEHTQLAIICPITSKIKGLPFEVVLERTRTEGAVLPIHIRSVDITARKSRFIEKAPARLVDNVTASVQALMGVS